VGVNPNTVHLSAWSLYIADWVFWDRQRWRVFLPAFRPAVRVVRRKLPLFAAFPPSGQARPA